MIQRSRSDIPKDDGGQIIAFSLNKANPSSSMYPIEESLAKVMVRNEHLVDYSKPIKCSVENPNGITAFAFPSEDIALASDRDNGLYVISAPEQIQAIENLRRNKLKSSEPIDLPTFGLFWGGATLGFVGTLGTVIYQATRSNGPWLFEFLNVAGLTIITTPTAVGLGGVIGLVPWATAKAIEIGSDIHAGAKVNRIDKKLMQEIGALAHSANVTRLPDSQLVAPSFGHAVMSMLRRDENPKIFWEEHAKKAVIKVGDYNSRLKQLVESDRLTSDSGDEDEHVLRFKGQAVIATLLTEFYQRNSNKSQRSI